MNTETIEEVKLDEKIERTVIDPGKYNVVSVSYTHLTLPTIYSV